MMVKIKRGDPFKNATIESRVAKGLTTKIDNGKTSIHGADAGACARKVYLHTKSSGEGERSAASALYMAIGTAVHDRVAEALDAEGILLAAELQVIHRGIGPPAVRRLSGYIDLIVLDEEAEQGFSLIDIKTCGKLPSSADFWHQRQVLTYSLLSGIDKLYILYMSRNVASWDGRIIQRAIHVPLDELTATAETVARSHLFLNNDLLPLKPAGFVSSHDCKFCPFKPFCWEGGEPAQPSNYLERVTLLEKRVQPLAKRLLNDRPARLKKVMKKMEARLDEKNGEAIATETST